MNQTNRNGPYWNPHGRLRGDGSTVTCEACGLVQTFKPRQCGTLWLWVEGWDGDGTDPLHGAPFCSPACVVRFFADPAKSGALSSALTQAGVKRYPP